MHFQIGSMHIQASVKEQLLIIVPIGFTMIAVRFQLFRVSDNNSIKIDANIYQKDDPIVVGQVQRWLREVGG